MQAASKQKNVSLKEMPCRNSLSCLIFTTIIGVALVLSDVEAHENEHAHASLTVAALKTLQGAVSEFYTDARRAALRQGSIDEDRDVIEPLEYRYHFYNPRTESGFGPFESARVHATKLWEQAISKDPSDVSTSNNSPWYLLGRILHLLQDMTSPAHVHDVNHAGLSQCGLDNDGFENLGWCESGTRVERNIRDYVTSEELTGNLTSRLRGTVPKWPRDPSVGGYRGFIDEVADLTYTSTRYEAVLDAVVGEGGQPESDLKAMFPSLHWEHMGLCGSFPTIDFWRISEIGCFAPGNPLNDWWIIPRAEDPNYNESRNEDGTLMISGLASLLSQR
jgi:hypothetical protein